MKMGDGLTLSWLGFEGGTFDNSASFPCNMHQWTDSAHPSMLINHYIFSLVSVHKRHNFQVDIKTLPHFRISYTLKACLAVFTVKISSATVKTLLFGYTCPWEPWLPSALVAVNALGRLQAAKQSQVVGHHR